MCIYTFLTDFTLVDIQDILSLDNIPILIQNTKLFNHLTLLVQEALLDILLLGSQIHQLLIINQIP